MLLLDHPRQTNRQCSSRRGSASDKVAGVARHPRRRGVIQHCSVDSESRFTLREWRSGMVEKADPRLRDSALRFTHPRAHLFYHTCEWIPPSHLMVAQFSSKNSLMAHRRIGPTPCARRVKVKLSLQRFVLGCVVHSFYEESYWELCTYSRPCKTRRHVYWYSLYNLNVLHIGKCS